MGSMIRCIKSEYNIDDIENKIREDDELNSDFNEMFQQIKANSNVYVDYDLNNEKKDDDNHYSENFLGELPEKRRNTVCMISSSRLKI